MRPRPTQRPHPTLTPSITVTPSITYTPRATFTPTDTFTPLPPTATAIVLAISPQAEFIASLTPVALEATVIPPTVIAFTVTPLVWPPCPRHRTCLPQTQHKLMRLLPAPKRPTAHRTGNPRIRCAWCCQR
ncbi:MAG: hypothetical protein HC893_17160 [Chloroflexaceae bacterium]|nr:hypothetical protein [Chloroflexaceae bacterium]